MSKSLSTIILAAGLGKRMNNPTLPKVLAPMCEKPLLGHVLDTSSMLNPEKQVIIVGHYKEKVIDYIDKSDYKNCEFAVQSEQLGTGHAVAQAKDSLKGFDGDALILCGDVPLLTKKTLDKFVAAHEENNSVVSVLSTHASNPFGYGRIIRDSEKNFIKITEEKDANDKEKQVTEINSGVFLVDKALLFHALDSVTPNNAQGEYYLTDIISILKGENHKVMAFPVAEFEELQGVNTIDDLKKVELVYKSIK